MTESEELHPDGSIEDFALGLLTGGFFLTVGAALSSVLTGSVVGGLVGVLVVLYVLGIFGTI
jgi:hypothetical protein